MITSEVSGNRPKTSDRSGKSSVPGAKQVGLAIIHTEVDPASGYRMNGCTCGWSKFHKREKVVEDATDAHLNKKHGGRGIRM